MAKASITFDEIDRQHRRERARDEERLRRREITPEALQAENSPLFKSCKVTFDLVAYLKKASQ